MSDELEALTRERDLLLASNRAMAERCFNLEAEAKKDRRRWQAASGRSNVHLKRARDADAFVQELQASLVAWRMEHPDSDMEDPFLWDSPPYVYPVPEEDELPSEASPS